MTLTESNLDT